MSAPKINVGQKYLYQSNEITVETVVQHDDNSFEIYCTNGKILFLDESEIKKDLLSVNTDISLQTGNKIGQSIINNLSECNSITEILKKNIKSIEEGKLSTEQASSINESVKQIIEVEKTKIEILKLAKSFF